jgi:zinc transport system substrate-binding protein
MDKFIKASVFVMLIFLSREVFAQEKIGVVVSILPFQQFVEEVGGSRVDVSVMIPPSANPHTFEPSPADLKLVAQAKVYVKVGTNLEFEMSWMNKMLSLNKEIVLCDGSQGVAVLNTSDEHHEQMLLDQDHHHAGHDPHIWLSPLNAIIIVDNIRKTLSALEPQNAEYFNNNARDYIAKLKELDGFIAKKLSLMRIRSFIVFHPAWGYFADRYQLEQIAIEYEKKEPSAKDLAYIIKRSRLLGINVILASPQFSKRSSEVIAQEIKGTVAFIDPLAKNYIENLLRVSEILAETD